MRIACGVETGAVTAGIVVFVSAGSLLDRQPTRKKIASVEIRHPDKWNFFMELEWLISKRMSDRSSDHNAKINRQFAGENVGSHFSRNRHNGRNTTFGIHVRKINASTSVHASSFAFSETFALSRREIGQPAFAAFAMVVNFS